MKKLMLALMMVFGSSTVFAKTITLEQCVAKVGAYAVENVRSNTRYTGDISVVKFEVNEVDTYHRFTRDGAVKEVTVWVQHYANNILRYSIPVDGACVFIEYPFPSAEPREWRYQNIQLK